MKKLGIVLLLAVFTLSFVFANGAKEESTTNSGVGDALVIYTSNTEAEIAAMTAPFMKLYPDCEIEIVNGSFGELFARLQA